VCDECHLHTNEDNEGARSIEYLAGAGSKVLMMSGTPMQNSVSDLGSIFKLIAPDIFPDPDLGGVYDLSPGPSLKVNQKKLTDAMSPYIDRILAKGIIIERK